MINVNFNIRVPGSNRFHDIRIWHGSLPIAYKHWELQIYLSADIIDVGIAITAKQSHSGIRLCLGLLGLNMDFNVYDTRHWMDDKWVNSDSA
jgi:hypothetical protein